MMKRNAYRLFFAVFLIVAGGTVVAQPTSGFLTVSPGFPTNHGYIQLPSSSALNFAGQSFTFEAWVLNSQTPPAGEDCRSLAGNNFLQSTWIGLCNGTKLRSYVNGGSSLYTAGDVPLNNWTHIAVTFDHATRVHRHYIDGELAGERVETGPIPASTDAWRIFSDTSWERTLTGAIDEVRFWNVARTREQIRSTITSTLNAPQAGLVAVYPLDGNGNAAVGGSGLNGTKTGGGGFLTNPVGGGCTTTANELCVGPGGRFSISATFNSGATIGGTAKVVTALTTPESGLFYFFGANNWEVMVKMLDGCGINSRKWVFAAATTDQHFELVVTDIQRGVTKRYLNYAGSPAPAIIDVEALATCP